MTIAAMVAYAYDQIDQARAELEGVSKRRRAGVSNVGVETSAPQHIREALTILRAANP